MGFSEPKLVTLERGWAIILRDLEVSPEAVLRRARLPLDLASQDPARVSVQEYFNLFHAVAAEANDPNFAIRLGSSGTAETFHPVLFAALCCEDLQTALRRISTYKRLIAPAKLRVEQDGDEVTATWEWDDPTVSPPVLLAATELVFMVQLARIGTRERVVPLEVAFPTPLGAADAFAEFFGVAPSIGPRQRLKFSAHDAARPFLTASDFIWSTFEPVLQRRLTKLDALTPLPERVRSLLLECLPSGASSVDAVGRRLGMSARTLQRKLGEHGVSYRELVRDVRLALSLHYVEETQLSYVEVALLVGFDEPSSFFRSFREWTGTTPEHRRHAHQARASPRG